MKNWSYLIKQICRCSTWNMCRLIFSLILSSIALVACNKPNPNPELGDQIYQDMLSEMKIAESGIAQAEKDVAEHRKAFDSVKPQTGQIKYAEKRVNEAEHRLDRLNQQKKYWLVRSESRRDFVRQKSLEAFNKGETWSDSKEFEAYQAEKRLRKVKLHWDSKERLEEFKAAQKKAAAAAPK